MNDKEKLGVNEVVSKNFFKYLKEKGISQAQYAKDNILSQATISNWKNGNGTMSSEHIKQAADYFGITVNDLFYDDNAKKKIEVLADKKYHPIMAQQTIETKLLNQEFNKPFYSIFNILITYLFFIVSAFILVNYSIWWSLIILFAFLSIPIYFNKQFGEKKTFVINYLDDIYYCNKDADKLSKKRTFITCFLILLLHIISFISVLWSYSKAGAEKNLIIIIFVLIIISFVSSLLGLLEYIGKYPKKMYHYNFELYKVGITTICTSVTLFGFAILLFNFNFLNHILLFIPLILMVVLSFFNFYYICSNYKTYSLVYEDGHNNVEQLFKK